MAEETELGPSELGTKTYWDDFYENELENYKDHKEAGEVWFGMLSVTRTVEWTKVNIPDRSIAILDVGCGNGMSLLKLAGVSYTDLTGVDYSEPAIALAKELAKDKPIRYEKADILTLDSDVFSKKYDLILDKGTYDAISLSPDDSSEKRKTYINNIHGLLSDNGSFFITSCNWTNAEVRSQFIKESGKFQISQDIPTTQLLFGGEKGGTVACLIFKKK